MGASKIRQVLPHQALTLRGIVLVLVLVIEKRAAPLPRWPEQNSCGKIVSSSRRRGQQIEDEHEHDSPCPYGTKSVNG